MTSSSSDHARLLDETRLARRQAEEVLHSLLEAKANETAGEAARKDMYKQVTGASSIDNAIATARRSIETFDRILSEIQQQAATSFPPASIT
jgi:hypothetical protein